MKLEFNEKTVKLGDINISLEVPIKKALCINKIAIVLVDDEKKHSLGDHSLDRNIYAFNGDGDGIWQVEQAPGFGDRPRPYTNIRIENGKLIAYNWIGVEYSVNLKDGTVTPYNTGQRPW